MQRLKVYGGMHMLPGGQRRLFVAASSMAGAAAAITAATRVAMTTSHMRHFWAITGNPEEVEPALANPGWVYAWPKARHVNGAKPERVKP